MESEHEKAAASKPGAPWHHVNTQHGLLDWTLGELYGIPDYRAGRDQVRGSLSVTADMIERLASRSVEAGRSAAGDVPDPSSLRLYPPSAAPLAVQVVVHHPERVRLTPDQAMNIYNAKKTKTSRTAALLELSTASLRKLSATFGFADPGLKRPGLDSDDE